MRGKHPVLRYRTNMPGSIPACAGEAYGYIAETQRLKVYPRVCGGSVNRVKDALLGAGLSPRVRGKRRRPLAPTPQSRSIPACAGEASLALSPATMPKVYPRVCGGSGASPAANQPQRGLSPRVRGKPTSIWALTPAARSIPACAGEARINGMAAHANEVYPRVCGGSWQTTWRKPAAYGLSPRVRGKHRVSRCWGRWTRSIPACAGEAQRWTTLTL